MANKLNTSLIIKDEFDLKNCRICFKSKSNSKNGLLRVFGIKNYGAEIYFVTGVIIVESSHAPPAYICHDCLRFLKLAVDFRKKCRETDEKFRKITWAGFEEQIVRENLKKVRGNVNNEEKVDFTEIRCKVEVEEDIVEDVQEPDYGSNLFDIFDTTRDSSPEPQNQKEVKPRKEKKSIKIKKSIQKPVDDIPLMTKCEICWKLLGTKSLRRHMVVVHHFESKTRKKVIQVDRESTCDRCGRVYPNRKKLTEHMRWHLQCPRNNERPWGPCSVCGNFFKTRDHLNKHEKTHIVRTIDDFFLCDLCGHRFKFKSRISDHIKKRHIEKIRFHCPHCPGVSYATKGSLKIHVDFKHLNIRRHVCDICQKAFAKNCKLKAHRRVHTGEKPYVCKFCDKRFMHEADHMRHVWAHTGTRKYTCKTCRRSYNTAEEREAHKCPWKY